jgi:hypothetical protein
MKKKLPIVVCLDFVYLMYNSKKRRDFSDDYKPLMKFGCNHGSCLF